MATRIVIAGAGPAGITVAETLRRRAPGIEVVMLSAEPYPPYSPPAMADHFLTGRDDALYWKGRDVCARLDLDFHGRCRIESLDSQARRLRLAGNETLRYDHLVVATGAGLWAPVEGGDLPGVYNFKSLSAAEQLIAGVRAGKVRSALVVGAGFIGVEIALLLQDLGVQVRLLEAEDRLIPAILEPETAAIALRAVQDRGVEVLLNTRVAAFTGRRHAGGVRLESGEQLAADCCIAATGVKPNIDWLAASEVDTRWGVVVDDFMHTTAPDVWAAGDVAEARDLYSDRHYVHAIFPNAIAQAGVVASALLGEDLRYEGAESMNSLKHLGVEIIAAGDHESPDQLCLRRDGVLRKLFFDRGRIVGYSLVGDIRAAGVYRSLMLKGTDVTPFRERLLDPRPGAAWLGAVAA